VAGFFMWIRKKPREFGLRGSASWVRRLNSPLGERIVWAYVPLFILEMCG
jgi:hypothetical protein